MSGTGVDNGSAAQPLLQGGSGGLKANSEHGAPSKEAVDAACGKMGWRLLPVLFMVTFVCYVDRTNISLAAVGMSGDIGLSKAQYGNAASLFFVTYIIFQIPSNFVLKRVGAPVWLGVLLIGWGITASLTAFVRNAVQLYGMRLVLGAFEAGTFPGLYYYVTIFFPSRRMSYAVGVVCAGILGGLCVSAPLAGGLLSMDGLSGFSGWQWLLFIEGFPSMALGVFIMFYLPKVPSSASFLSMNEKEILRAERCLTPNKPLSTSPILKGIVLNWPLWTMLVANILQGSAKYATQFWTPLWIHALASGQELDLNKGTSTGGNGDEGSGVLAAFLSTIPYSFAAFASIAIGWSSTHFRERKCHLAVPSIVAGILFALLPTINKWGLTAGVAALTLINGLVGAINGPSVSLSVSYMTNENIVFGLGWLNAVGNLCGLIGPFLVGQVVHITGSYEASFYFSAIFVFISSGIFLVLRDDING